MTAAAQPPAAHTARVEQSVLGNRYHVSRCTCGWRSPARRDWADAIEDQDEHLAAPDATPEWVFRDDDVTPMHRLRRSRRNR